MEIKYGSYTVYYGADIQVFKAAHLEIGDDASVNFGLNLICAKHISIGRWTGCLLYTSCSFHPRIVGLLNMGRKMQPMRSCVRKMCIRDRSYKYHIGGIGGAVYVS